MPWFVYILRCSDRSLYCGTTTDLDRRLEVHNAGTGARYTRSRLPVQLVWHVQTTDKVEAIKEEFRIKRLPKHRKELLVVSRLGGGPGDSNPIRRGLEMTKAELVGKLAEENKVTKKVAAAVLDSLVKNLQEVLKKGEKIRIDGLGTFVVAERKARTGVNPRMKAKIKIAATKAPKFRAAKALKEAVTGVHKKPARRLERRPSSFEPQHLLGSVLVVGAL
jgi:predicted GIY-YIG superfamily endonuclease/nucleoid DNA-binding protein